MTANLNKYEKFVNELKSRGIELHCRISAKTGDNWKVKFHYKQKGTS
jgi:hypothetical protein